MVVSATSFENELAEKFFDYCGGNNVDWENPNVPNVDPKVKIYDYTVADDIVYFSAVACWLEPGSMEWTEDFGEWRVYSPMANSPSLLSMYVKIGDEIYTIEEAWEKGLVTDLSPAESFSKYTIVSIKGEVDVTEPPTEALEPPAEENKGEAVSEAVSIKAKKKKQPMTVKANDVTVKAKTLKKKNVTIKNAVTVKKAKGTVTYAGVSKGSSKYLAISKKGVITVKKGDYEKNTALKIKTKVTANGNSKYKGCTKTVTVKIKIR